VYHRLLRPQRARHLRVARLLGIARAGRDLLHRARRGQPEFGRLLQHLFAPGAERLDHVARDTKNVELAVLAVDLGLIAKLAQFKPQLGMIGGTDQCGLLPQGPVIEGHP
jgi:hypothetical protein